MDKQQMKISQMMKESYLKNRLKFARCRCACAFEHKNESKFELETYYRYDAEVELLEDILRTFKKYDNEF